MSGLLLIDWAALALSLFNTILLIWLGLTVLLAADRRTAGVALAGSSLLLAGGFFVTHTVLFGLGLGRLGNSLDFWWRLGWFPVAALPCAWYAITLWYGGYWDDWRSAFHRRHRPGLYLAGAGTLGVFGLLAFANPFPTFTQLATLQLAPTPSLAGVPVLMLAYPVVIVVCIGLSLDALARPGPSARLLGDLARRRARPWLIGTSGVLLALSLLVAGVMAWAVGLAATRRAANLLPDLTATVAVLDVLAAGLVAAATVLAGQAIVAYEIFTGRALPRGGLRGQWRNAIFLAAGYSLVIGGGLALALRPLYSLMLTALLMTLFYALFSWRTHADREDAMRQLRPFVSSQRVVEQLIAPALPTEVDSAAPFRALCESLLGARWAVLAALGPQAPLAGPPLTHPAARPAPPLDTLAALAADARAAMAVPLEPARLGLPPEDGPVWLVPLWSERGLIGALLLGPKRDGGLYTQEAIEVARASGERLIDAQAGAEMARRLLALQRQRLAESQLLDRRAHRLVHDEVLPELHAALLRLDGADPAALALLTSVHKRLAGLLQSAPARPISEPARLGLLPALRVLLATEFPGAFGTVAWQITAEAERACAALAPLAVEVLFYAAREAVRNAARYGRGADGGPLGLTLTVTQAAGLVVCVDDDGVGPAPTMTPSGHGLALHQAMLAIVGGTLEVGAAPGRGTRVTLRLPLSARRED